MRRLLDWWWCPCGGNRLGHYYLCPKLESTRHKRGMFNGSAVVVGT